MNSKTSFDDRWDGGLAQYLEFMGKIMAQCHRVLINNGTIYVHWEKKSDSGRRN